MTEHMDLTRFEELAMTHGPDLDAWPADVRADATALLAESTSARELCDQAAALWETLEADAAVPAVAPDALMARILADAATAAPAAAPASRPSPRRPALSGWLLRLTPPAALAASAVLGVMLGYSTPETYSDAAFGTSDDEIWTEALNLTGDPDLFDDDEEGEGL